MRHSIYRSVDRGIFSERNETVGLITVGRHL